MAAVSPDARAARDWVLPDGVSGGCHRNRDVWASPVAGAGIMAMMG